MLASASPHSSSQTGPKYPSRFVANTSPLLDPSPPLSSTRLDVEDLSVVVVVGVVGVVVVVGGVVVVGTVTVTI